VTGCLYKLEGETAVLCADSLEWAAWLETADRHVASEYVGKVLVSTVFLGLNHRHRNGEPLLFETLVLGGTLDDEQERYPTWGKAEAGHKRMVQKVREVPS